AGRPGSLNGACSIGAYEYVRPADHVITDCSSDAQFQTAYAAGGRITFNCGSGPLTISLTNAYNLPTPKTIIHGTGSKITFNVGSEHLGPQYTTSVWTLNNLTFTGATDGALSTNNGTLIVINSTVSGNQGSAAGAAGIESNFGTLIVSNTTLSGNTQPGHY